MSDRGNFNVPDSGFSGSLSGGDMILEEKFAIQIQILQWLVV